MSPGEPKWSKRILFWAAGALKSSKFNPFAPGSPGEPKLEQTDFITGRWGSQKLKIKSVCPKEPNRGNPAEPNWSEREPR